MAALDLTPGTPGSADPDPPGSPARMAARGPALRIATWIGSAGLLVATLTDALAVLGRHVGIALLGSIEVVQLTVVLIASAAMIIATAERGHAAVHIVTGRLPPRAAERCRRAASLLGALVVLAIAAGSAWVLADLWDGVERTELLGLPLRWFRLLWIGAALAIAGLFARQAIGNGRR